jgi:hypothetical protein
VYSGHTGGVLWTFTGEAAYDDFGYSVSGAGDINNDGYADLVVGASGNDAGGSGAGRTYVYSGQTGALVWTFTGEAAGDHFGEGVSGAGDVNNDGYEDLIVGATGNDAGGSSAGRAYVYSGRTGALIWTFTGEATFDNFGNSVSGFGDSNNDCYDDLIVGAPYKWTAGEEAGRAYVYSGQTGTLLRIFDGEAEYDEFGTSVSGAGDVNNDGFNELIVGAPRNSAAGDRAGQAYVLSCREGESFVRGDANGDGIIDVGDVVYVINYLFKSGPTPNPIQAADATCDGNVDVGDVVFLINYLFRSGPPPSC